MFWCLVRLSTGALNGGLQASPLEMAIQSAVACSKAKDGSLLVSWQLMECVLVWVISSSLAVKDGFLFITDRSFDFSIGQIWWGILLSPSFFCELICHFISPNASVRWYPLKYNTGSLSKGADVLCEFLLRCIRFSRYEDLQGWECVCEKDCFPGLLFPRKWWFLWHSAVWAQYPIRCWHR